MLKKSITVSFLIFKNLFSLMGDAIFEQIKGIGFLRCPSFYLSYTFFEKIESSFFLLNLLFCFDPPWTLHPRSVRFGTAF